jgi:hypothetical protein
MLLFFLLALDVLTNYRLRFGPAEAGLMDLSAINPVLLLASLMVAPRRSCWPPSASWWSSARAC